MIYTGVYKNIDNENIVVTIRIDDGNNYTEPLLLAENAVTVTSVSDSLFSPIKAQTATIRVLTNKIYSNIYSNTDKHGKVYITNQTKQNQIFRGYVTPNIYNQEYVGLDELEIEAVSAVSTLKHIKYKKVSNIISWYGLIKTALSSVGYDKFYIADSYTLENKDNFLKELYQFEGNFFDNDEEKTAWTYYDILQEFCKYFCLSLVEFQGEVYFVDYYNLNRYIEFNLKDDTYNKRLMLDKQTITADSYKGTGANISYDETYNKVAVKCNLYCNDMEQNPIKDEDLVNQNADQNKHYINTIDVDKVNYTYVSGFFNNDKWDNYNPDNIEVTPSNIKTLTNISLWQKEASYKTDEVPSSLNWETYLTAYNDGKNPEGESGTLARINFDIVRQKNINDVICNGGYFILNLDYKLSTSLYASECIKSGEYKYETKTYNYGIPDTKFPCKLQIGDYFYNGEKWSTYDDYNRKVAKGYFKDVFFMGTDTPRSYYKYKDADGDWTFCLNKAEWDALPEGTVKETGSSAYNKNTHVNMLYWVNQGVGKPPLRYYVDELFYNECILRDKFYIIHRNKEGDKIFDDIKRLKNTASWQMNIDESEDGVAIALPNFILSGKLIFSIQIPDVLGTYPQGRTKDVEQLPVVKAVHINKCNLVYKSSGATVDIFNLNKQEDDVVYTNIIDDNYVNEWDNLELKVNTQLDNKVTSYSSMLRKEIDKYYFIDQVYDIKDSIYRIQEENIIMRYYRHFKTPKVILEACLRNTFTPLTEVIENNLKKLFVVDSYELDVDNNAVNIKLIEL